MKIETYQEDNMFKLCPQCDKEKELNKFHNNSCTKSGKSVYCKECVKERRRNWYLRNREEILQKGKIYDQINKKLISERKRKYGQENKEKIRLRKKQYTIKNRESIQKKRTIYTRNRRRIDIQTRMASNLRRRINSIAHNSCKAGSAVRDLGCSIFELKNYIESKFQSGMSWDNYGPKGWHIDHIQPLSKFDLTNQNDILIACHFTNLQPLWHYENLSKGAKT